MIAKVLLVDDEEYFVETLAKRLTKRGLNILTALSGPDALETLEKDSRVDVVILDVRMPQMDGIEALRQIKANYPLVEVIMLTGHATVENAIEGMRLGALDYLMKPCDMEILMSKIREAASKKRKHEEKIAVARGLQITLRRGD